MAKGPGDHEFVQSLARGLAVLQSFDGDHTRLTLTEVAGRTQLTRATARRFLHTLVRLGYVASDDRYFWLRPQVLSLGHPFLAGLPWWRIAQPIIEEASRAMGQACNASVLDGVDITYVSCVTSQRSLSIDLTIGSRLPAYATASGRVLLAALSEERLKAFFLECSLKRLTPNTIVDKVALHRILDQIRQDGHCYVDQELRPKLRTAAVPIVDRAGTVMAALSIGLNSDKVSKATVFKEYLPILKKARGDIQNAIPG